MKPVLVWAKSNPIALGAALLCIASVVGLIVVHGKGSKLKQDIADRSRKIRELEQFQRTAVRVPSSNIDEAAQSKFIPVNEASIKLLDDVYRRMDGEFASIFGLAVSINRGRHQPLIDGIFPSFGERVWLLVDAQREYVKVFSEFYARETRVGASLYPRLNAGGPIPMERLQDEMARIRDDYLNEFFPPRSGVEALSEEERQVLTRRMRHGLIESMRRHASTFHIYADAAGGSAFQIGAWSRPGTMPSINDVWEGQMSLWVQQDIVEAIAAANGVANAERSVIDAPIKRLLNVEVVPGYVGINSSGGLTGDTSFSSGAPVSGEHRLPDDFSKASTGRRSNSIYDVKHAWINIHVDFQRMPEVFDSLTRTNFITVLKIEMTDVDEYETLRQGYYYGSGTVVQARILIESLWLREWTKPLMPDGIRRMLGIPEDPPVGEPGTPGFTQAMGR